MWYSGIVPERAVTRAEAVLEDLRGPACALRAVRARDALRPPGGAGCVELDRRLALVEVERARVRVGSGELLYLALIADDDFRPAVRDAVLEVVVRDAMRERDDDRAEPLTAPVQLDRLGLVREDACDSVSGLDAARRESGGDAGGALPQVGVGQALLLGNERLCVGRSLGRVEKAEREVHAPATSAIASTIGV